MSGEESARQVLQRLQADAMVIMAGANLSYVLIAAPPIVRHFAMIVPIVIGEWFQRS